MSDFTSECPDTVTLDPYKRVCYTNGLVLGVDEFLQEELYLLEKHRLHNRSLHGYGTICGLQVSTREAGDAGPEVRVSPGLALDPVGHEIRVPQPQCARLDEWLLRNPEAAELVAGSPAELTLFVVLCYRECKTDEVPIPSGPCRTLEDSTAPSRIADAFELSLRTEPPAQVEENAIRAFGDLLRAIEITDGSGGFETAEDVEEIVRSMISGSPPGFEPFLDASPPGIRVRDQDAEEVLRAAFRVWVTDVRPQLLADGRNCSAGPPREDCVLLAELAVPVAEVGEVLQVAGDADSIEIEEGDRPYLLQTRVLQECCIAHAGGGEGPEAPVVTVHGELEELVFRADATVADDHPQYLLVDETTRALLEDLDADGNVVANLRAAIANGEAVRFEQAVKVGDQAAGPPDGQDVTGTYPDRLRVVRIQNRQVRNVTPNLNEVLTWTGARWEPQPVPGGGPAGPSVGEEGLTRIFALSWRHRGTSDLRVALNGDDQNPVPGLIVGFGFEELEDGALVRVNQNNLSSDTFQLFFEKQMSPSGSPAPGVQSIVEFRLRINQAAIRPVQNMIVDAGTGLITGADLMGLTGQAPGAVILLSGENIRQLVDGTPSIPQRLLVRIKSEFVRDRENRAIDGEFNRTQLPTGNRPAGSPVGIQGGRFESWLRPTGLG